MNSREKFEAGLRKAGTCIQTVELTPELKDRLNSITDEVIDLLHKRCKGPTEAYMIVDNLKETFEEMFDIKGGIFIAKGETGKS